MKKSTLALSVAAALGGFGFVGSASAMVAIAAPAAVANNPATGQPAVPAGTQVSLNLDGIGHQLIVPYFSTQGANATLFEITNHDTVNGKLVKVRFRGAGNSDDLFDFTLMLSPGDVWTAAASKDSASELTRLVTSDKSCTLPASVMDAAGNTFVTSRVDPTPSAGTSAQQTREGYVEIFNVADIAPTTLAKNASNVATAGALFTAIKHVNNVAPCTAAVFANNLTTDPANDAAANAAGLTSPTGGLSGDWVLINQTNTAAWSGAATALQAVDAGGVNNATGSIVFFPQTFGTPAIAIASATADPLMQGATPVVTPQYYDLPDLSTPYAGEASAAVRADALTTQLSVKTLAHQIVTTSDIGAVTDVVFSQPTRRYHAAVNYKATSAADNVTAVTGTSASIVYRGGTGTVWYRPLNTDPLNRQVCVVNVNAPGVQGVFNREETSPTVGPTNFVISPNVPSAATILALCGETSVVSINQGGTATPSSALTASIARSDVTFTAGYEAGWASWYLPGVNSDNSSGLPVIANTFIRARNGSVNYGFGWPAKVTR